VLHRWTGMETGVLGDGTFHVRRLVLGVAVAGDVKQGDGSCASSLDWDGTGVLGDGTFHVRRLVPWVLCASLCESAIWAWNEWEGVVWETAHCM